MLRYKNPLLNGAAVPDSRAGEEPGEVFQKTVGGRQGLYTNRGSARTNNFQRDAGMLSEYVFVDAGQTLLATGVTAPSIQTRTPVRASDLAFAEYCVSDDTDQPVLCKVNAYGNVGMTIVDPLAAHAMTWVVLGLGRQETFAVFAAGTFASVGSDAVEDIAVAGAIVGDICFVQVQTKGAVARTIAKAIVVAGSITVTLSADPSTDHVLNYVVLRPVGTFRPSHYVVAAGSYSVVTADAAAMAIAVSGARTTDIPFSSISKTNDTDVIVSTKVTASNVLTITNSADPDVDGTHIFDYFLLRAL